MATFKIHPEALKEIEDSASFYEIRQEGLGNRFLRALNEAIRKIESHPFLYREIDDRIRKCRLLRFPYGVIYRCEKDWIEILAIMHLKRKPGYWKYRK